MASQQPHSPEPPSYFRVRLLQAIRDRQVSGWEGLDRFMWDNDLQFVNQGSLTAWQPPGVASLLKDLQRAGLVEVEGIDFDSPSPSPELVTDIKISPTWQRIQETLGISLTSLAKLQDARAMVVIPADLPEASRKRKPTDIFVVMPFRDELKPIYHVHIRRVCRQLSSSVSRADDFFGVEPVMADIWDAIRAARIIIADCTGRNANVFYEIGLAHVLGKPVVLLSQDEGDAPFDLGHIRFIKYIYTPPGMKKFEKDLKATLSNIL
jgi:hypothetical protein